MNTVGRSQRTNSFTDSHCCTVTVVYVTLNEEHDLIQRSCFVKWCNKNETKATTPLGVCGEPPALVAFTSNFKRV